MPEKAPVGFKRCPRCTQTLPLVDPATGEKAFGPSGYCRPCAVRIARDHRDKRQAAERAARGEPEPLLIGEDFVPTAVELPEDFEKRMYGPLRAQGGTIDIGFAPSVPPAKHPLCACCLARPTQIVREVHFCTKCAYYIAVCGVCCEHGNKCHFEDLTHNPRPIRL